MVQGKHGRNNTLGLNDVIRIGYKMPDAFHDQFVGSAEPVILFTTQIESFASMLESMAMNARLPPKYFGDKKTMICGTGSDEMRLISQYRQVP